jgi:LmbE family N-acetylglucosaminyl deacetylase
MNMKTGLLKRIFRRLFVALVIVSLLSTIFIFFTNKEVVKAYEARRTMTIPPQRRVLVISPHQDDETLFAGGYMIRTMEEKGEVYVLYTVDGITRYPYLTKDKVQQMIQTREKEVRDALGMIGITGNHIIFLRNENRKALMTPDLLNKAIDAIGHYIQKIKPDTIVIPPYEGGHCDHDMTNFAVTTAVHRFQISNVPIYEGPDYNHYKSLRDYVLTVANWFSVIARKKEPNFINYHHVKVLRLALTDKEKTLKRKMLDAFKSQKIGPLKRLHGGDDIYRQEPAYDYSRPPYAIKKTLGYKACSLFGLSGCADLNCCKVPFSKMRQVMLAVKKH